MLVGVGAMAVSIVGIAVSIGSVTQGVFLRPISRLSIGVLAVGVAIFIAGLEIAIFEDPFADDRESPASRVLSEVLTFFLPGFCVGFVLNTLVTENSNGNDFVPHCLFCNALFYQVLAIAFGFGCWYGVGVCT
jgi:hypothetical protein